MPDLTDHSTLTLVAALLFGVIAVARLTRLITSDMYPPAAWVRDQWERRTTPGKWQELATCPFCAAPYIAAADGAWAWLGDLDPVWWGFNVWLSVAYLAAMIVVRDEPPEEG